MEKIYIVGMNRSSISEIKTVIKKLGFKYSKLRPDIVISLGGDGTFLYSERKFPGVPKLLVRDSDICQKCDDLKFDEMLMKISLKEYEIIKHIKLEARYRGRSYTAVNDFVIRNRMPVHAIRFEVTVNRKRMNPLIGDGIVVATPFGSSGYYGSISRKTFRKGIGIAFNNTTTPVRHLVLDENAVVRIRLLRHNAYFGTDNDPAVRTLREKDTLTIRKSKSFARIIRLVQRKR